MPDLCRFGCGPTIVRCQWLDSSRWSMAQFSTDFSPTDTRADCFLTNDWSHLANKIRDLYADYNRVPFSRHVHCVGVLFDREGPSADGKARSRQGKVGGESLKCSHRQRFVGRLVQRVLFMGTLLYSPIAKGRVCPNSRNNTMNTSSGYHAITKQADTNFRDQLFFKYQTNAGTK